MRASKCECKCECDTERVCPSPTPTPTPTPTLTSNLTRLFDMTPLELEVFKLIEEMLAQKALMSSSTLQLGVRGCAQAHRHAGYANAPAREIDASSSTSPTAGLNTFILHINKYYIHYLLLLLYLV